MITMHWLTGDGGYLLAPALIVLLAFFGWHNRKRTRPARHEHRHPSF